MGAKNQLGRYKGALVGFGAACRIYAHVDMAGEVADCDLDAADAMFHSGNLDAIGLALDALIRYEALERPVEIAHAVRDLRSQAT